MSQPCHHKNDYTITWDYRMKTDFKVVNGVPQAPENRDYRPQPHLRFECGECGYKAFYGPHCAPKWFHEKLSQANCGFPQHHQPHEHVETQIAS